MAKVQPFLAGPPGSAKPMFLTSSTQLKDSYFAAGAKPTKAEVIDYLFDNRPGICWLTKLIK
ncbi:MAG TPA: hypothetical protein VFI73_05225 [Candidatus Nitrosopolaris sp.]|nr:hypothetical protein [Candidatus Nitrosopolaris sp.]